LGILKKTPMKKLLVICAVLISTSAFISSCGTASTAKTYQCPMKCEGDAVTYDSAGKCPICGMDMAELK
jgi:protein SCO1/2